MANQTGSIKETLSFIMQGAKSQDRPHGNISEKMEKDAYLRIEQIKNACIAGACQGGVVGGLGLLSFLSKKTPTRAIAALSGVFTSIFMTVRLVEVQKIQTEWEMHLLQRLIQKKSSEN